MFFILLYLDDYLKAAELKNLYVEIGNLIRDIKSNRKIDKNDKNEYKNVIETEFCYLDAAYYLFNKDN